MKGQSKTIAIRLSKKEVELLEDILPGLIGSGRRTEDSYYLPYAHYFIVGFVIEECAKIKYRCGAEGVIEDLINILYFVRGYPAIRRYFLEVLVKEIYELYEQLYEQKENQKEVASHEEEG